MSGIVSEAWWLIDFLLRSALVLAVAGTVSATLLRRRSASARHLLWTAALGAVLALPALQAIGPAWAVLPAWTEAPAPAPVAPTTTLPVHDFASDAPPTPHEPAAEAAGPPVSTGAVLVTCYAAVAAALLIPIVPGRLSLWRLERRASSGSAELVEAMHEAGASLGLDASRVRLLLSDDRTMPMTWGIYCPRLLLPADAGAWTTDRLQAVLLHELAHVRRRDVLTQLLGRVACAIAWLNPLVWAAHRRQVTEQERAADDAVLAAGCVGPAYADHVLDLARSTLLRPAGAAAIAMARPSQLEGRLLAILDPRRRRGRVTVPGLVATATLALAILVPAALLRGAPEPADDTAPAALADRAGEVVALIRGERFADAHARFAPVLQKHLTPDQLADAWRIVTADSGGFIAQRPPTMTRELGFDVAYVPVVFEKQTWRIKVVFDDRGAISGIWTGTPEPTAADAPPPASQVYIMGVPRAGAYTPPDDGLTLLQLIASAGGFPEGATGVDLIHAGETDPPAERLNIPIDAITRGERGATKLQPGDTVVVRILSKEAAAAHEHRSQLQAQLSELELKRDQLLHRGLTSTHRNVRHLDDDIRAVTDRLDELDAKVVVRHSVAAEREEGPPEALVAQVTLNGLEAMQKSLSTLERTRSRAATGVGEEHPRVRAIDDRIKDLEEAVRQAEAAIVRVEINHNGGLSIDDRPYTDTGLERHLRERAEILPDLIVQITADADAKQSVIVEAIDAAKRAGVERVTVAVNGHATPIVAPGDPVRPVAPPTHRVDP